MCSPFGYEIWLLLESVWTRIVITALEKGHNITQHSSLVWLANNIIVFPIPAASNTNVMNVIVRWWLRFAHVSILDDTSVSCL
jgi:hypothetical protein